MSTLAERREAIARELHEAFCAKEKRDPTDWDRLPATYKIWEYTWADRIRALEDEGAQEPVAYAVMADGFVMAANRNTELLAYDRVRLVSNFPNKTFAEGLVPLYTRPPSEEETP